MIIRRLSLPWLVCSAVLLVACGSAKYEWSQASSLNTIAAYQTFLSKYPNDVHAADAMRRIAELQDAQAWSTAQVASTVQGYQQYVSAEPNGAHLQAAQDEITSRERSAAWHSVEANETAQSLQEFLQKYPASILSLSRARSASRCWQDIGRNWAWPTASNWPIASAMRWRSVSARSCNKCSCSSPMPIIATIGSHRHR